MRRLNLRAFDLFLNVFVRLILIFHGFYHVLCDTTAVKEAGLGLVTLFVYKETFLFFSFSVAIAELESKDGPSVGFSVLQRNTTY